LRTILLFLAAFFCPGLRAQDPFHISQSIAEEFPTPTVYSVNQDVNGVLWFTTDSGIVKYDSHTYTLFNTDDGLADNEIFQMKRDSQGRTWFMTLNGKLSYYRNERFCNETDRPFLKRLSGDSILMDFFEDASHNLYFVFKSGELVTLAPNGKIVRRKVATNATAGYWKVGKQEYVLTNFGVYNTNTGRKLLPFRENNSYYRVYHRSSGVAFSAGNRYFTVRANGSIRETLVLPASSTILHVWEEGRKTWVCTRNGLFLYENGKLRKRYFEGNSITSILKDFEGGYWLSTLRNGVVYVPSFEVFVHKSGLKINCVSINPDKEVWFGSEKNDYYIMAHGAIERKQAFTRGLPDNILKIRFFRNNTYIVGKSGILQIGPNGTRKMIASNANDLYESEGRIYFGTSITAGFNTAEFSHMKSSLGQSFLNIGTNVITGGKGNTIWLGTNTSLYKYDPTARDTVVRFDSEDERLQASIKDLFYDDESGILFAATTSKGLLLLENDRVIDQIGTRDGLNSNSCTSVKKIGSGTFLVGTNNGLNRLHVSSSGMDLKNLNSVLGIKDKKVNDIACADGIVYLATNSGLLTFALANIDDRRNPPRCVIESITNKNHIVPPKNRKFRYADNGVSIKYNGISYRTPDLSYHYKLDDQKEWTTTTESRVNYPSLPAGLYRFQVYCDDGSGMVSDVREVRFEILPPFWQETWFRLLILLLLAFLSYGILRFWMKRKRREFEEEKKIITIERDKAHLEKQMIELEQKALRLQMNPHFIFNALNTIKGYYAIGDPVNASHYISKFSKLLRMLLENTEQMVTLEKEIEMIELYIHLNKIRYKDIFDYTLTVDKDLDMGEVAIPTMLLQPIVENAIIHGLSPKNEKGMLKIAFLKKGNSLECIVEDDGIGREAAREKENQGHPHQSKALEITTERLHLFSGDSKTSGIAIFDLYGNGKVSGTKVIIHLPLRSIWQ